MKEVIRLKGGERTELVRLELTPVVCGPRDKARVTHPELGEPAEVMEGGLKVVGEGYRDLVA